MTSPSPQSPVNDDLPAGAAADEAALRHWLQRVALHDEAALAALYGCLCNRVFRQALRVVHEIAAAEEVVEDVFWQVWREAPRFEPARLGASAWLQQITDARARAALSARGRNPLPVARDIDDQAQALVGLGPA